MGNKTAIAWCDSTWNPIRGCSKVSAGCDNCYAMGVAYRFSGAGQPYEGLARKVNGRPAWTNVVRMVPEHIEDPIRWKRSRRIFVNSMSDLFHESLTNQDIAKVFAIMHVASNHTYQVLTKRPERMQSLLTDDRFYDLVEFEAAAYTHDIPPPWPLPHVWLGTSVEHQQAAEQRIPWLLKTPAAIRFLSCEPLLERVTLDSVTQVVDGYRGELNTLTGQWWPALGDLDAELAARKELRRFADLPALDWVIVGGESGPRSRPMEMDWAVSARVACQEAGTAFFFKQAGVVLAQQWGGKQHKGEDPTEWPLGLQVQEFPKGA